MVLLVILIAVAVIAVVIVVVYNARKGKHPTPTLKVAHRELKSQNSLGVQPQGS